jgi:hypothetical protein
MVTIKTYPYQRRISTRFAILPVTCRNISGDEESRWLEFVTTEQVYEGYPSLLHKGGVGYYWKDLKFIKKGVV